MLRVAVCLFAILTIFGASACAQETSKADIFAGYSLLRANPGTPGVDSFTMNGGSASLAYNYKDWLGIVGDFGGYHDGNILGTGVNGTVYTYLFGPRVSYRKHDRFTAFGQVLFGGAHINAGALGTTSSDNSFAMSLGGGVDARINSRFSVRVGQVEYLMTRFTEGTTGETQHNLRFSTGVVLHF